MYVCKRWTGPRWSTRVSLHVAGVNIYISNIFGKKTRGKYIKDSLRMKPSG